MALHMDKNLLTKTKHPQTSMFINNHLQDLFIQIICCFLKCFECFLETVENVKKLLHVQLQLLLKRSITAFAHTIEQYSFIVL